MKSKIIQLRRNLSYTFKVSYNPIIWRRLRLNRDRTLADLHEAIADAYDLDSDITYSFSADLKKEGPVNCAPRGTENLEGPPTDAVLLTDLDLASRKKLRYSCRLPGENQELRLTVLFESEDPQVDEPFILLGGKGSAPAARLWADSQDYEDLSDDDGLLPEEELPLSPDDFSEEDFTIDELLFFQDLFHLCVGSQPEECLENCLSLCSLQDLRKMAEIQELGLAVNARKEELVKALCAYLPGDFRRRLPHLFPEDMILLDLAMEERWADPEEFLRCDLFFQEVGFVYLFASGDKLWAQLPRELQKVYEEAVQEGLFNRLKRNQKMGAYATALVNLYGIYEAAQFAEVWNQYNKKDPITRDQAAAILSEMEDIQACYWYDSGYVISDYFQDDMECRVLLETAGNKPYYMPTEKELRYYADSEFDTESPRARKLQEAAARLRGRKRRSLWSEEDLVILLMEGALFQLSFDNLIPDLRAIHFIAEEEPCQELKAAYEEYACHSRSWLLRGFRPADAEPVPGKPTLRVIPGGKMRP